MTDLLEGATRGLRVVFVLGLVFAASIGIGAIGGTSFYSFLGWTRGTSPAKSSGGDTSSGFASIKRISGGFRLPPLLTNILQHADDNESILLLLAGDDLLGCEDLGRQLRRLRFAAGARRMVIAVPIADHTRVNYFVNRERIRDVAIDGLHDEDWLRVLSETNVVATPAAMVVDGEGEVIRGVMHMTKVRNVRAASFAEELGLVPAEEYERDAHNRSEKDSEHINR